MFKNYLNMVFRSIWKYKVFSAINILGLAVGLACSLLILMYVQYELSYDRYHEKEDRIYRTTLQGTIAGNVLSAPIGPYPMAAALRNEFPEVETAARFRQFFQEALVSIGDINYQEAEVFHVDPQFFDIFSLEFLAGDKTTALTDPNTVVITETIAAKYFPVGGLGGAIGQTLRFDDEENYRVTGVIEDVPINSHFHPEFLVSFTSDEDHDSPVWISNNIYTYVLLTPGSSESVMEEKLQELVPKYVAPQIQQGLGVTYEEFYASGGRYEYGLQALADIHLFNGFDGELQPPGNAAYVYTFQAIAIFILILACINFMNLSTARSANRAREIGVRKVLGAYQGQLIGQFLTESIIISLLALALAIPLISILLPSFNALTERNMSLGTLLNPVSLLLLLAFATLVGTLSGSYPALFLSRFHPQEVLKGKFSRGSKQGWLRSGLVVFQFVISISLVAATLIVFNQLELLRNMPLGFAKEQIVVIKRVSALGDQQQSFKEQVLQQPNVINASATIHVPGDQEDQNAYMIEGRPASETHIISRFNVGYDFIETLDIELLEGRTFSEEFTGSHPGYIVNEAALRELNITNPLETRILEPNDDGPTAAPIIGVVKDFHYRSLHEEIRPLLMEVQEFSRYLIVRVQAGNIQQTLRELEDTWRVMTNGQPFEYSFLEEDYNELHQGDQKMGEIFAGFSALAVLIACLGLYGLASFTTEQRTKEIGIRKTLGASVSAIVLLLSKEFMVLVLIAILVSIPIAYFTMNEWLQLFAYRIDIGSGVFAISGIMALLVAFITVSYQSTRAALTNPVLTLRDE